jgi:translocation and assembly module TamA
MGQSSAAKLAIVIAPTTLDKKTLQVVQSAAEAIAHLGEDQDGGEIERLRRRARDAAKTALATQGYFGAKVRLSARHVQGEPAWHIAIEPGPRAQVTAVDIVFTGRITQPAYQARRRGFQEAWGLPVGQAFINENWDKAKTNLLDAVGKQDFLLARVVSSSADVQVKKAQVRLRIVVDSGPAVRMGALRIQGLKRLPPSLVQRYVSYTPGDPYEEARLNQWQQALQDTAFFRGAFVSIPLPPGVRRVVVPAEAQVQAVSTVDSNGILTLPLQVQVMEAQPRQAAVSLGVNSDTGAGVEVTYRQQVVLGQPVTLESGVGMSHLLQRAYMDFHLPINAQGNKDSIGLLANHDNFEGEENARIGIGAARVQERRGGPEGQVGYERQWRLLAAHEDKTINGVNSKQFTLTGTLDWLRREVDDQFSPRSGNLVAVGVGSGVILNTGRPYANLRLRGQRWWPVGQKDILTVRGEVGRVWANSSTVIPIGFGFRTGGARTIRGYRYLSIGLPDGASVAEAPMLLVSSMEYDHYFSSNWGLGFFVDAGNAARTLTKRPLAVGYGVGLRVRTPAGPLFLDVAYGQRDHVFRLSFSLGTAL